MKPAVFLDRDGVLIADVDLLTKPDQLQVLPGVPEALVRLRANGFFLVMVSNQTVVARGLATEDEVRDVNERLGSMLRQAGGASLDACYFCPHHPQATLPAFRVDCVCRKPAPGMFRQAAREHGLDLAASYAVGDRITDIVAGSRAGCRTVLVQTGMHLRPPIQTSQPLDPGIKPDHTCADLTAAADWILTTK